MASRCWFETIFRSLAKHHGQQVPVWKIQMFGIGTPELLIVAAVLLLLFGGARLPALMRNMGRSINEFKAGIREKPKELVEEDTEESDTTSSERNEEETPVA